MRRLHWYIARHYLGSSRGRGLLSLITWIALGGVTVGVTALVVVIAVMTGMQEDLRGKILESTPHVIVLEQSSSLRLIGWQDVVDSVLAVDGIVGAAPFALSQVSIVRRSAAGQYSQPATLYGVAIDTTLAAPTEMERRIIEGSLNLAPPKSGLPPLLVGRLLADRMQIFEGDSLVLMSLENLRQDVFGSFQPTLRQFEVTGTFTTGMYDYDLQNVYTTLEAAQELIGLEPGTASGIGARTADPEAAPDIARALGERLGYPYYVESWVATNRALFSALKLEKLAMGLILFLVVLVAAFNIVSTLVMVVSDRTREIGILKAMGMTRRGILSVFVLQGAWIGVTGTALGTFGGLFLSWLLDRYEIIKIPPDVYFVDHLPVSLQVADVALIVFASIAVAFLATIYPALQASRLEPVDAIRHD
ncbi:MAG TPA: ABC transporter permease [Longimicrobiales bacterium]|nr:ABC transporter permease [Longimicrobiales bacterium]